VLSSALFACALAGGAAASHNAVELVSDGGGAFDVWLFGGSSSDGGSVVFETFEPLTPDDTDLAKDVYRRSGSTTTLVSTTSTSDAGFAGMSTDGQRVLFETEDRLDPTNDEDDLTDIYERVGGTTTLVSTGPDETIADVEASLWVGHSSDATKVAFITTNSLTSNDVDAENDIYVGFSGNPDATSLVSLGTTQSPDFSDMSANGEHVFFESAESLVAEDTDGLTDVYRWTSGVVTLVSVGTDSAEARYEGSSADGLRVFFRTTDALPGDPDSASDVYELSGADVTQISTGPDEISSIPAAFAGASSDGTRVFFETEESLTSDDMDGGSFDVYERAGDSTSLVSAGGNGEFLASFAGAAADGGRVFFETAEPLSASDGDSEADIYERAGTATTLISGGNGAFPTDFAGSSTDGSRVFFETDEAVCAGDGDTVADVYERFGGATTLVSSGGNGPQPAAFLGSSDDGGRVLFETSESVSPADADGGFSDIYAASVDPAGPPATCSPPPASSGAVARPARPRATPRPRARRVIARLSAARTQRVLRQGGLFVSAFCDRACTATATTRVNVPRGSRVLRLRKVTKRLRAGARTRMKIKLTRKTRRQLERALRRKKRLRATVRLDVRDALGSSGLASLSIRLRR
jgi:hypothetical protein